MDEVIVEYIRRTVLKIPRDEIMAVLQKWGFLSEAQLQTINFRQTKEGISHSVAQLCEESSADLKQAALLDIIYNHIYPNKRVWSVYHMNKTGEETDFFDFRDFKKKFRRQIQSALINVTINFREYEDNAIWIRIAWGTPYTKPNQYKTSYVVYHSQTPYVFISASVLRSNLPLLCQAMVVASNYHDIHEMELRSHCLNSLKDIVFKRYSQNFQTNYPLQERNVLTENVDLRINDENRSEKERIYRLNQESFGNGPQPKLDFAQYKLETMFKSDPKWDVLEKKEPFRCLVKFSSPHLLESLKSLAPAGLADAPLSPLLTCIPQKARNYFKIREKKSLHPGSFMQITFKDHCRV
ncbi:centromere protein N isoform X1 [Gallus gallus]|uniref:Centromere protein N n=1 Tax=Gallus gallus TaxID=9031 RepID=A0A452J7Y9_CHICK|nr:centromere protein N isoform 2 [Gallus gallus]XP_025009985.1 centromere protein N isoform X1 [Gallus gallus]XP_046781664.1 centromere protein N isoform X1 [Gallus gallus]|eukprot:XP_025009984.1 centromere protein N isoform X1 [Gallus gallus]